jgi:signal transduction histidine kinase
VVLNLYSNALKFTKKGGFVRIKCKYIPDEDSNGSISIHVIDSGVGIKEGDKHKLFQLFGFLEQTKELNTKGIGLGLHISKMIVN